MHFLNFKKFIIIAFIIICPLILINIQRNHLENFWLFRFHSAVMLHLRNSYSKFHHSIANTIYLYTYLINVKKNNRLLKLENTRLKTQLLQMKELTIKNQILNQMLDFKNKVQFDLLSARVIGQDPFPDYNLITVDKGQKDGVQKHQPALVETGVIGYVLRVQKSTSQILLLTNRNSVLPAIVQRSRVHGIIEGHTPRLYHLKYLQNEDDIAVGDNIITSGIDQNFPTGLPIGIVSQIKKDKYGLNPIIEVLPSVHFSNIEELFIILNKSHEQKI